MLVSVMLSCLFIVALWSPTRKGLTSWFSCVMFSSVFVTFPCGVLGLVRYLIVSIPDLCFLSYFVQLGSWARQLGMRFQPVNCNGIPLKRKQTIKTSISFSKKAGCR